MDVLQFVSSIIGSLAWPAAVVWLAFLLRAPLAKLIPRVRGVKYGDLHVDIAAQIEDVKEQVEDVKEQVEASGEAPTPPPPEPTLSFQSLAKADPRAAILSAWIPVEIELNAIAEKTGLTLVSGKPAMSQLMELQKMGALDNFMARTLAKLRRIRNAAVHVTGDSVNYDDAIGMGEMCGWVTEQLKRINQSMD